MDWVSVSSIGRRDICMIYCTPMPEAYTITSEAFSLLAAAAQYGQHNSKPTSCQDKLWFYFSTGRCEYWWPSWSCDLWSIIIFDYKGGNGAMTVHPTQWPSQTLFFPPVNKALLPTPSNCPPFSSNTLNPYISHMGQSDDQRSNSPNLTDPIWVNWFSQVEAMIGSCSSTSRQLV